MAKQARRVKPPHVDVGMQQKLPAGVKLARSLQHTGMIGRIAWSPEGRTLATASYDKTIRLWNAESGECVRTLEGHRHHVNSVAFHRSGAPSRVQAVTTRSSCGIRPAEGY